MTTIAPTGLTGWLDAAAVAASSTLPSGVPLTPGRPELEQVAVDLPAAIVVPFGGSVSGEFALLVDQTLVEALRTATIGSVDLADALAPTVRAVGAAVGTPALGVPQEVDAALAMRRITHHSESGVVLLTGTDGTRAAVAIGIDANATSLASAGPLDRFDLLRGVEMQASVELGRAKLTINALLSLRNGEVIELDRGAGEPADLYVNGRLIARGEVVVVDENYGLRVTELISDDPTR